MRDKNKRFSIRILGRCVGTPLILYFIILFTDENPWVEVLIPAIWAISLALGLLTTHIVQYGYALKEKGFRRHLRLVEGALLAGVVVSLIISMINWGPLLLMDITGYYWTLLGAILLGGTIGYAATAYRWGSHTIAALERKQRDYRHPDDGFRCELCNGSGVCTSCHGTGVDSSKAQCSWCDGTGSCPVCGGMGHTKWLKERS